MIPAKLKEFQPGSAWDHFLPARKSLEIWPWVSFIHNMHFCHSDFYFPPPFSKELVLCWLNFMVSLRQKVLKLTWFCFKARIQFLACCPHVGPRLPNHFLGPLTEKKVQFFYKLLFELWGEIGLWQYWLWKSIKFRDKR